jgi:hypothetical protein
MITQQILILLIMVVISTVIKFFYFHLENLINIFSKVNKKNTLLTLVEKKNYYNSLNLIPYFLNECLIKKPYFMRFELLNFISTFVEKNEN